MGGRQEQVVDKEPFDSRLVSEFSIGDLVSYMKTPLVGWQDVREYGFIEKIYSQEIGREREFMFAKIIKTDGSTENFMLSCLTLESKNNKDIEK